MCTVTATSRLQKRISIMLMKTLPAVSAKLILFFSFLFFSFLFFSFLFFSFLFFPYQSRSQITQLSTVYYAHVNVMRGNAGCGKSSLTIQFRT